MSTEQSNSKNYPIGVGAVVEATDGLVGNVTAVIKNPQTGQIDQLIVTSDTQGKQFTIPANLIAGQTGSQVVHLSVARDQLAQNGVDIAVDTNTGNIGHPDLPMPQ